MIVDYIRKYKELIEEYPVKIKIRNALRNGCIYCFSKLKYDNRKGIRIINYHHIFDDEVNDFKRHIHLLKNNGDIISLDQAYRLLKEKNEINDKYFVITFDDGFKNCYTNTIDILLKNKISAAYFIPTDYIGKTSQEETCNFYKTTSYIYPKPIELLTWSDCKCLSNEGMIIGSHTTNHLSLVNLNDIDVEKNVIDSKLKIESEIDIECKYFAAPQGHRGKDFYIDRDESIVKNAGFKLFLTTDRGTNTISTNPFMLYRDHLIAKWGNYQLKYFLGLT